MLSCSTLCHTVCFTSYNSEFLSLWRDLLLHHTAYSRLSLLEELFFPYSVDAGNVSVYRYSTIQHYQRRYINRAYMKFIYIAFNTTTLCCAEDRCTGFPYSMATARRPAVYVFSASTERAVDLLS